MLAGWGAGQVDAKSIVLAETNATGPVSGQYTYTYSVTLTGGSEINSGGITSPAGGLVAQTNGDYFALIDFPGYVTGSATTSVTTVGGAAWQITTPLTGLLPVDGVIVPDNAGIINVDFQYVGTGAGTVDSQTIAVASDTSLGSVTLKSTQAPNGSSGLFYSAQDEATATSLHQSNQGLVLGPTPSFGTPEPASLALLGLGALGLIIRKRRGANARV